MSDWPPNAAVGKLAKSGMPLREQLGGGHAPNADKAFQRTRMAPAVSHEKGMDYQKMAPKLEKPLGARPREARMSTRPVSGRRR